MTKEEQRKQLEAMLAASSATVTKVEAKPMDASLSASFKQVGIDKKRQTVKSKKPSGVNTTNPVTKRKRVKRNWELQRRYDEIHGTVNGYDPDIEAWNDFHRNEMEG